MLSSSSLVVVVTVVIVLQTLSSTCYALNVPSIVTNIFSKYGINSNANNSKKREQEIIDLKTRIRTLSSNSNNGISIVDTKKTEILKLVTNLEKKCMESKLTSSRLIDGDWNLLFTTNTGSSAGKLGPFVGRVSQKISLNEKKYYNNVNLNGIFEGSLLATWDNVDSKKWNVKFKQIEFKLFGLSVLKKELTAEGIWRMSYIDSDFRILYAQGGKNAVSENIYILAK